MSNRSWRKAAGRTQGQEVKHPPWHTRGDAVPYQSNPLHVPFMIGWIAERQKNHNEGEQNYWQSNLKYILGAWKEAAETMSNVGSENKQRPETIINCDHITPSSRRVRQSWIYQSSYLGNDVVYRHCCLMVTGFSLRRCRCFVQSRLEQFGRTQPAGLTGDYCNRELSLRSLLCDLKGIDIHLIPFQFVALFQHHAVL